MNSTNCKTTSIEQKSPLKASFKGDLSENCKVNTYKRNLLLIVYNYFLRHHFLARFNANNIHAVGKCRAVE